MIKLKNDAIKTMADALAKATGKAPSPKATLPSSSDLIYLNRKLREAFKISVNPKDTPLPRWKTTDIIIKPVSRPILTKMPAAPANAAKETTILNEINKISQNNQETDKTAANKATLAKENQLKTITLSQSANRPEINENKIEKIEEEKRRAEEKRKKEEEEAKKREEEEKQRRREQQKKDEEERQRLAEEKRKKEEEEAKKREEEEKQRRREAIAAQERNRKEKRRRLEILEMERKKRATEVGQNQEIKKTRIQPETTVKVFDATISLKDKQNTENLSSLLKKLTNRLQAKKKQFEEKLAAIPSQISPLEQKKANLETEASSVKKEELASIEAKEKEIEEKGSSEKEKLRQNKDPELEKTIEQSLWSIEEQRKSIEKQRWAVEDKIAIIVSEIEKTKTGIEEKNQEILSIKNKAESIANQIKLADFALEKGKMEEEMLILIGEKEKLAPMLEEAKNKKTAAETEIKTLSQKQFLAETELDSIEKKEKQASDPKERRRAESNRWQASNDLKKITQLKWETQEKSKKIVDEFNSLSEKIKTVDEKINKIQDDISNNETILRKEGLPANRLRDAISSLLKENGIQADAETLNDIVQTEENPKNETTPETNTQAAVQKNEIGANNGQAAIIAPVKILEEKRPEANIPTQPENTPTPNNKEATDLPAPNVPPQKTEEAAPKPPSKTTAQETQTETSADKNREPQEKPSPAPAANKTTEIPKTEAVKQIAEANKTTTQNQTSGKEKPQSNAKAWGPETNLNEISKSAEKIQTNNAGNAAKPQEKTTGTSRVSLNTVSFYREQVENSPATNIREFPKNYAAQKKETPKQSAGDMDNPENDQAALRNDFENRLEAKNNNLPEQPASLDNRWNQIKSAGAQNKKPLMPNQQSYQAEEIQLEPKPSGKSQLVIKILVVLLLVGIIAIILLLTLSKNERRVTIKNPITTGEQPIVKKEPAKGEGEEEGVGGKEDPGTVLATISPITIYTEDLASVPNLVFPYLQTPMETSGYYKLSIQNKRDNTKVGLRQFFNIYNINAPTSFYSSLSDEAIFFIYSNNGKNRLGLVATLQNADSAESTMKEWEKTMQDDTNNFFKLLGRKNQPQTSTIKFNTNTNANGIQYRAMDFAPANDNFSLAWAIHNKKYIIIATSKESLAKVFDQLPK